jgi:hypothetical protein
MLHQPQLSKIVEVNIPDYVIEQAKSKANALGELNNSIREGKGNLVGFIGELIVSLYFGGKIANTYDYDVIIKDRKIDVKTKETTVPPKPHYFCTVADYNTKQKCDAYYFVRVTKDLKKAYLLGGLSKEGFYKKAQFFKKNTIDPTSNMGWTFTADCYNVYIQELYQMPKD